VNLQNKIESEKQIFMSLIERYKQNKEPGSSSMILAYEYGLQVLMEVYEISQQKEVIPF